MKTVQILATLGTAGLFGTSVLAGDKQQKPNMVIIIGDDISANDLGCYGSKIVKTPNIDALARDGIRFTNAFLTISSSSPSRSSIITGRYPHNTGACELHSPLGEEQVFFPCFLKDAGYYTAQAGKWHIGGESIEPNGPAEKCFDRAGGSKKDGGGESGAEKFVPTLKERPKDKPFFMWFATHDAHRDWDKELDMITPYDPGDVVPGIFLVNDAATRKDLACYYNEVSRFDYFVGEVVRELKRQKVLDNTLIIVMADNGRPFPRAKTLVLDEGIKTPFIIHYPNGICKKGSICNSLVSVVDIAPTLIKLAGAQSSPTFQGRSFDKLLIDPDQLFRNYVFAEHNWHANEAYERMVATDDYVLIENKRPALSVKGNMDTPTGKSLLKAYKENKLNDIQKEILLLPRPEVQLFDRKNDPKQIRNLVQEKPGTAADLLKILHQWQDETGDTTPEYLKPDRSKEKSVDYLDKVEMPGQSRNAKMINNPGPF
jgi:arylsulfatase A-like enzyme